VSDVFGASDDFEVSGSVVLLIQVTMVDLESIRDHPDDSGVDQSVRRDGTGLMPTRHAQHDAEVALAANCLRAPRLNRHDSTGAKFCDAPHRPIRFDPQEAACNVGQGKRQDVA